MTRDFKSHIALATRQSRTSTQKWLINAQSPILGAGLPLLLVLIGRNSVFKTLDALFLGFGAA